MKKTIKIAIGSGLILCATTVLYSLLVLSGIIKASGRDQHIIAPIWAKAAFYPAAKLTRLIDLCSFRSKFLGTWQSTDSLYPYKLTLTSLAFDTASGQLTVGDKTIQVTLRDERHPLYRGPFGNPIMMIEGQDGCFIYFNRSCLQVNVPTGPWKSRTRPMHSLILTKAVDG